MLKNEKSIPFEEAMAQIDAEREERMRPFRSLSWQKRFKRIWHIVTDFVRYKIVGAAWGGGVKGLWYWLRCHLWDRYHILDLGKYAPDYKWGWLDRDRAMFLACFHCLVEYVEEEDPFEYIDWDCAPEYQKVGQEIRILYDWWKTGRAQEHATVEALLKNVPQSEWRRGNAAWDEWVLRNGTLEAKDDEMLERLLKIRKYLWT